MQSRNRRILRSLLTVNLLPLLIRLGVVILFAVLIFGMDRIFVRGVSSGVPMTIDPDGSLDIRLPLSGFLQGRLALMAALAALALLSFILGIATIIRQHQSRADVPIGTVQGYLDANRFRARRSILMLRPFEQDGFLVLPVQRGFWRSLIFPAVQTETAEQVFQSQVAQIGDIDIIAIVDPNKDELVPGPVYLQTGDDWQADVARLMAAASGIVFVIPPDAELTPGLAWEIDQTYGYGFQDKSLAVFPPKRKKTAALPQIQRRFMQASGFAETPDSPLDTVIQLDLKADGMLWREVQAPWPPWPQPVYSDIYHAAASAWLSRFRTGPKTKLH